MRLLGGVEYKVLEGGRNRRTKGDEKGISREEIKEILGV